MSQRSTAPDDGNDWRARHARCQPDTDVPCVIVEDIGDDWERRHAETRRSSPS